MKLGTPLGDHEEIFSSFKVSQQSAKDIDPDELIILYANNLSIEIFGNWIQTQMTLIDNMLIMDFKGHVGEEARYLNLVGFEQGLDIDDANTIQANLGRHRNPLQKDVTYDHCDYSDHINKKCHKKIIEEYLAKQTRRQQAQRSDNNNNSNRNRNRNRNREQQSPQQELNANIANIDNNVSAYNTIFDDLIYCCKTAINDHIRRVNGVWIKD